MISQPVATVMLSVAHLADGVPTVVHLAGYTIDLPRSITVEDTRLAAEIAAAKFRLALSDRLGDTAEQHRIDAERE